MGLRPYPEKGQTLIWKPWSQKDLSKVKIMWINYSTIMPTGGSGSIQIMEGIWSAFANPK